MDTPVQFNEKIFLIYTYRPGGSPLNTIVNEKWSILGRNKTITSLHFKTIVLGKKKKYQPQGHPSQTKRPEPKPDPKPLSGTVVKPIHPCIARSKWHYCLVLDLSGNITSNSQTLLAGPITQKYTSPVTATM